MRAGELVGDELGRAAEEQAAGSWDWEWAGGACEADRG